MPLWCCCKCWRRMSRCSPEPHCPDGAPELFVPCPDLENPQPPPTTYLLRGACYEYVGDVDEQPDPTLIESRIDTVFASCVECCDSECYVEAELCFCETGSPNPVFVPCASLPPEESSFFFLSRCWSVNPAGPFVSVLPPDALVATPAEYLPDCVACCPELTCEDCVPGSCPEFLKVILPDVLVNNETFGGNCTLPSCEVIINMGASCFGQVTNPICGTCSVGPIVFAWSSVTISCLTADQVGSPFGEPGYFIDCQDDSQSSICRNAGLPTEAGAWLVSASISGQGTQTIAWVKEPSQCQPGVYVYHCQTGCSAVDNVLDPGIVVVQEHIP